MCADSGRAHHPPRSCPSGARQGPLEETYFPLRRALSSLPALPPEMAIPSDVVTGTLVFIVMGVIINSVLYSCLKMNGSTAHTQGAAKKKLEVELKEQRM